MNQRDFPETYRNDFPSLQRRRNGKPPVYLDNACTTLVPRQVISALNEYYTDFPACGGRRSRHWFAVEATERIEGNPENGIPGARRAIAEFIGAGPEREIIFTLNATHAVNVVAGGFRFSPGDVVLLTDREHNSNLLPWLQLRKRGLITVDHMAAGRREDSDTGDSGTGDFDLEAFERRLSAGPVRLVSMAWTSNVTGVTLPAQEIIAIAHRHGALVLLDGAQTVPHQPVDVRSLDVDFLAFSLHKMCGPRGVGILCVRKNLLGTGTEERWSLERPDSGPVIEPTVLGGGTVSDTTHDSYRLLDGSERFEAGIQNYAGLIASGTAVEYLRGIGMDQIGDQERRLNEHLTRGLQERFGTESWLRIIGPPEAAKRGGILTFEVKRPNAMGIAKELDIRNNIMIRDGVFCVHSYFNELYGKGWTRPLSHRDHRMIYRVSLYFYNTIGECELFLDTLDEVFRERSYIT